MQTHTSTPTSQPPIQLSVNVKPLCVPKLCDDTHKIDVQLDQPLWSCDITDRDWTADILSYCIQLNALILTSSNLESPDPAKKTVTFEQRFPNNVINVLDKVMEILIRKGITVSVEEYLHSSGIGRLFPQLLQYLQNPNNIITVQPSTEYEGYIARVTALNNLLVLAQQLLTNIQTSVSHKYIAHQLALLYQTLGGFGEPLVKYKKTIESRFAELKDVCSPAGSHFPRLTSDLQKWLINMLSEIITISTSFNNQMVSHLQPFINIVTNT